MNGSSDDSTDAGLVTLLDLCVSSLRRVHANLLCIVPILTDDPRRESNMKMRRAEARPVAACRSLRRHCVYSRSGPPPPLLLCSCHLLASTYRYNSREPLDSVTESLGFGAIAIPLHASQPHVEDVSHAI